MANGGKKPAPATAVGKGDSLVVICNAHFVNIDSTHVLCFTLDFEGEDHIFSYNISCYCVRDLAILSSVEADIYFNGRLRTAAANVSGWRWLLHHLHLLPDLHEDCVELQHHTGLVSNPLSALLVA